MTTLEERVDSFREYWGMSAPKFGEPKPELPPMRKAIQPEYWKIVVRHAQANPGQWFPLEKCPLTPERLQSIAWGLRTGATANIPIPMRIPGMQGRWFRKQFWFKYDRPED
jgi:hypothetical protein